MSKRDDFQKSMDENLAVWGARLTTLKAKLATDTPAAGKAADEKQLAELQARCDAASSQLEALKNTSGDPWDVRKLEMARAWHDLDTTMGVAEQAVRAHDDAERASASQPAAPSAPIVAA